MFVTFIICINYYFNSDVKESEIENILAKSIISFPQNGIVTLKGTFDHYILIILINLF